MNTQPPCTCQEWQENYSHIERAIRLARAYNYDVPAIPFRFCPWCGDEIDRKSNPDPAFSEWIKHGKSV